MSKYLKYLAVLALAMFAGCATNWTKDGAYHRPADVAVAAAPVNAEASDPILEDDIVPVCTLLTDGRGQVVFPVGAVVGEFQLYGGSRIRLIPPTTPGVYFTPAGEYWFNATVAKSGNTKAHFLYVPNMLGPDNRPIWNWRGSGCGIMVGKDLGGKAKAGAAALMIGNPNATAYPGVTAVAAPLAAAVPANTGAGAAQNCNCDKPTASKKLHRIMKAPKANTPKPCPPGCVAAPAAPAK